MKDEMAERLQKLNDTRALLDWLEAHPEVELPLEISFSGFMIAGPTTKDEITALARSFGECEKNFLDDGFMLRKRFGSTDLHAYTDRRNVCERVVVGTEEVPATLVPARTREIVEWRCAEPLLTPESKEAA